MGGGECNVLYQEKYGDPFGSRKFQDKAVSSSVICLNLSAASLTRWHTRKTLDIPK